MIEQLERLRAATPSQNLLASTWCETSDEVVPLKTIPHGLFLSCSLAHQAQASMTATDKLPQSALCPGRHHFVIEVHEALNALASSLSDIRLAKVPARCHKAVYLAIEALVEALVRERFVSKGLLHSLQRVTVCREHTDRHHCGSAELFLLVEKCRVAAGHARKRSVS
jgi:hypothetical protein